MIEDFQKKICENLGIPFEYIVDDLDDTRRSRLEYKIQEEYGKRVNAECIKISMELELITKKHTQHAFQILMDAIEAQRKRQIRIDKLSKL